MISPSSTGGGVCGMDGYERSQKSPTIQSRVMICEISCVGTMFDGWMKARAPRKPSLWVASRSYLYFLDFGSDSHSFSVTGCSISVFGILCLRSHSIGETRRCICSYPCAGNRGCCFSVQESACSFMSPCTLLILHIATG